MDRGYTSSEIYHNASISIKEENSKITIKCEPEGQEVQFSCSNEIGKGYDKFVAYEGSIDRYFYLTDYENRLKIAGVYPFFYL